MLQRRANKARQGTPAQDSQAVPFITGTDDDRQRVSTITEPTLTARGTLYVLAIPTSSLTRKNVGICFETWVKTSALPPRSPQHVRGYQRQLSVSQAEDGPSAVALFTLDRQANPQIPSMYHQVLL